MTTDRLTDEELAELDSMSEAAEGCDCGCASSRAAFGCADAIPVLLAEVRKLRAENAYSRLSAADRELVLALPALIRESADTVRADERAKIVQHLHYAANMLALENRDREAFVLRHEAAFVERGGHKEKANG
jgi:hypothetical protein